MLVCLDVGLNTIVSVTCNKQYFESVAKIPPYADPSFLNFENGEKMKHPTAGAAK